MKISRDALWKGIIEELFQDFMGFFYPDHYDLFDFSVPPEFLDKELQKLFPESQTTQGRVDILAKVRLKDGTESWILIHIEIQGYRDKHFGQRMFGYFYRIYDIYGIAPAAIALFTDNDHHFHPKDFSKTCLDTAVHYKFRAYKLKGKSPEDFDNTIMCTLKIQLLLINLTQNYNPSLKTNTSWDLNNAFSPTPKDKA